MLLEKVDGCHRVDDAVGDSLSEVLAVLRDHQALIGGQQLRLRDGVRDHHMIAWVCAS